VLLEYQVHRLLAARMIEEKGEKKP